MTNKKKRQIVEKFDPPHESSDYNPFMDVGYLKLLFLHYILKSKITFFLHKHLQPSRNVQVSTYGVAV